MKKDKLKIDLRNAEPNDMIAIARIMMSLKHIFTQNGYKIHLRRSQTSQILKSVTQPEHLFSK